MKLQIQNKKSTALGYNDLPISTRREIMEGAARAANKEQLEAVKAYRETCCKVSS